MSSKKSLMVFPMDLQLPPTPPMDLSDSNSNSSHEFKVSFIQKKYMSRKFPSLQVLFKRALRVESRRYFNLMKLGWLLISLLKIVHLKLVFYFKNCAEERKEPSRLFMIYWNGEIKFSILVPTRRTKLQVNEQTKARYKIDKIFTLFFKKKSESREWEGTKIFPISFHPTSIHRNTQLTADVHVNIFVSTLNPCMTYDYFVFIKRRRESEANAKLKKKTLHTHWV